MNVCSAFVPLPPVYPAGLRESGPMGRFGHSMRRVKIATNGVINPSFTLLRWHSESVHMDSFRFGMNLAEMTTPTERGVRLALCNQALGSVRLQGR